MANLLVDVEKLLEHADSEGHQDCSPAWMSFIFQTCYLLQQANSFTTRLKIPDAAFC